jgi:hypothetical protein
MHAGAYFYPRSTPMKISRLFLPVFCLFSALFCVGAGAQTDAYLYLVHAAPGRNVSATTNPALPVDVKVNDNCVLKGVAFGEVAGPLTLPAGSYSLNVSAADTTTPCSRPAVFTATATLQAGVTSFGVVSVTADHQFTGQFFQPALDPIPVGQSRVVIANLSDAALTAALTDTTNNQSNSVSNIAPLTDQTVLAPSGAYTGAVFLAGTQTQVFGPIPADLQSRNLYFYVLAGLTSNNSIQVIGKEIKDVL